MESVKAHAHQIIDKVTGHGHPHTKPASEQTILISGASGFIAAHILTAFLKAGYKVRGTVRSEATAEKVRKSHHKYVDQLSFAIVPDIGVPGAFDEAVKGVDGVIHTATPFQLQVNDNEKDLLIPAIEGTTNMLNAIVAHAPNVHRVVITSSFASMIDLSKGNWPEHTYTEADWNPFTYAEAAKPETNGGAAYCAAKALAEKAAWDFVKEKKPHFSIATICPPMVYGPNENGTASTKHLNTSSADIYRLMSPTSKSTDPVPTNSFWSYVDVRDVADAHLRAYELPEAANERFYLAAGNFSYQMMADIIRANLPELKDRVPVGTPGSGFGGVELYKCDSSKAQKVLGIKFRSLETCVVDSARSMYELEQSERA